MQDYYRAIHQDKLAQEVLAFAMYLNACTYVHTARSAASQFQIGLSSTPTNSILHSAGKVSYPYNARYYN